MAKILALDVGLKKIGVAIGDPAVGFVFARPALLVEDWTEAWPLLTTLVTTEGVSSIVVGWPLQSDGQPGTQADQTAEFMTQLRQQVHIPVEQWDERLTTAAVQREQAGRRLQRGQEDSLAAQLLLESYFAAHP